jgi:uncharacterized membrane protein
MRDFLTRFIVAGVLMAAIDAVWLTVIANKFYKSQIGSLLLEKPKLGVAVIFYLIYVTGIVLFVLGPALEKQSWVYALGYGALLGLFAYATYDLTNLATIKGFTVTVVIVAKVITRDLLELPHGLRRSPWRMNDTVSASRVQREKSKIEGLRPGGRETSPHHPVGALKSRTHPGILGGYSQSVYISTPACQALPLLRARHC